MQICETCGTQHWVPSTSGCDFCGEPFHDSETAWAYGDLGNGNYYTPADYTVRDEDSFFYEI